MYGTPAGIKCYTQTTSSGADTSLWLGAFPNACGAVEAPQWSATASNLVAFWRVTCLNCGFPWVRTYSPLALLRATTGQGSVTMTTANDKIFELPIAPGVPLANYTTNVLGGVYVSVRVRGRAAG